MNPHEGLFFAIVDEGESVPMANHQFSGGLDECEKYIEKREKEIQDYEEAQDYQDDEYE